MRKGVNEQDKSFTSLFFQALDFILKGLVLPELQVLEALPIRFILE